MDAKRGIVYFPLGSPTYDSYAADRIGAGLFGDCLLALDARTGKRLWRPARARQSLGLRSRHSAEDQIPGVRVGLEGHRHAANRPDNSALLGRTLGLVTMVFLICIDHDA